MTQRYTHIKNARILSSQKKAGYVSILYRNKNDSNDSEIVEIGDNLRIPESISEGLTVINMRGKYLCHGFIDLCVVPERKNAGEIALAAAINGFSSVLVHPSPKNALDASFVRSAPVLQNGARVFVCAEQGNDFADSAGVSDMRCTPKTLEEMKDMLVLAAEKEKTLFVNVADNYFPNICCGDRAVCRILSCEPFVQSFRDAVIFALLSIAKEVGTSVHISNVSRQSELEIIKAAKDKGTKLSADTSPFYFSMSESDLVFYGNSAKINPPLAKKEDVNALVQALADGTLDAISSSHRPCPAAEKSGSFSAAAYGASAFESHFALSYTNLVLSGALSKERLMALLCEGPAHIIGQSGMLEVGGRADFNQLCLDREYILLKNMLFDAEESSPFLGMSFYGRVEQSYINGKKI